VDPDIRGEAAHEIPEQFLSASKARARLGWAPRFTMDDGLERTIEWYSRYFSAR
jgi:CDP-glucose 4,6-dehydratase